jgi:hypothetical protein
MMAQAVLTLISPAIRERAINWIRKIPDGSRVEFRPPARTLPQNRKMRAMLTDVATQKLHAGRRYDEDTWKLIFMSELGIKVDFVPSLDNSTMIPIMPRSSELSVEKMSGLIEIMYAWGAENGVKWTEDSPKAQAVLTSLRQRQPRLKAPKHLDLIRQQPCCICGDNTSTEAAHIRAGSQRHGKLPTGMAEKPDDKWTVPLCGKHHRAQHAMNELEFWRIHAIDPFEIALSYQPETTK